MGNSKFMDEPIDEEERALMEAIENGMVDVLIIWENIDFVRLTMKNNNGETRVETISSKKVTGQKFKPDDSEVEKSLIATYKLER